MRFSGKIALEEHVASPDTAKYSEKLHQKTWDQMSRRILDIHGQLLAEMDAAGIELSILSLNAPLIQAMPEKRQAIEAARRGNDWLAEQVAKAPTRFQAFAALPMQDPQAAAEELERCVKQLGFRGAKVNGFSQVDHEDSAVYYDLPQYRPFWETVQELDVPFYLHPRDVLPSQQRSYEGHPWLLGPSWAFGVETATHALRLMASGLFDQCPKLNIVLGHLGETLPTAIWRVDHWFAMAPRGLTAKQKMSYYLRNNFYFTTSGNFCTHTLVDTIAEVGIDRILFAADYPFENMIEAAHWFDGVEILSEQDRTKIARANAAGLLKLPAPSKQAGASA
jgi:predicted TIM-barrel fold metal-dependent hydrolase